MARSQVRALTKAFKADKVRSTTGREEAMADKEKKAIKNWTTLFRRNWDIYAEFWLEIQLKPFQRKALHLLGVSDDFFFRAGRGISKTFLSAIAAICELMLYPNARVVITASTVDQANKIVEDKIQRELINNLSPYLLYLYNNDLLKITKPTDGYLIENTLNNSTLRVVAPVESSRGIRSTFTIYDECRLIKKSAIDSIFQGMFIPRQPIYLNNPKYKTKRWIEQSKSIYLTSSRFKYEWWYSTWKTTVSAYYNDKRSSSNVYAADIFVAIDNGLKTWADFRRMKSTSSEMDFRMEYLNEAVGESDEAFFSLQSFNENRNLEEAFRPPTPLQIRLDDLPNNPPKGPDEVRLVIADFAFADTTSHEKTANTIMGCMSLHWKGEGFERHFDYIEGHRSGDSLGAIERAKELYYDYDADYFVFDTRNGGETLFNYITIPRENQSRGSEWNTHGFGVIDKEEYHVAPKAKLDNLRDRTVDPTPVKCMIPFIGTTQINSMAWAELKKQLEKNNIKFLISMEDRRMNLIDNGEYVDKALAGDELPKDLLPYAQTDDLITEAVNLKAQIKNDNIHLSEPRSGTKDRVIVLSYGNYIASLIENEWNKQNHNVDGDDEDFDSFNFIW